MLPEVIFEYLKEKIKLITYMETYNTIKIKNTTIFRMKMNYEMAEMYFLK